MRSLDLPEMGAAEPWWLELELFGFEEDEDDDSDEEEEDSEDEDEDEEDEESEDDDESDEDEEDEEDDSEKEKTPKSKNIAGLKSALRKERMGRKKAEREVRRLKAKKKDSSSNGQKPAKKAGDDPEQVEEDQGPSERETRLAKRLLKTEVDRHILSVAQRLQFADPEDAINLVSRKDIVADQDEDDPTEIEVDEESVEDAVRELAKKKKHLIKPKTATRGKTGSKMGGRRKGGELNDEALRKKFGLGAARN